MLEREGKRRYTRMTTLCEQCGCQPTDLAALRANLLIKARDGDDESENLSTRLLRHLT